MFLSPYFDQSQGAKEESVLLLRTFYKGDELFLDMFDDEYQSMKVSVHRNNNNNDILLLYNT